jgi:hypothetical protein
LVWGGLKKIFLARPVSLLMVKVQNITVLPEKISNFVCNYKLKKSVYDKERDERSFASLHPVGLQRKKWCNGERRKQCSGEKSEC